MASLISALTLHEEQVPNVPRVWLLLLFAPGGFCEKAGASQFSLLQAEGRYFWQSGRSFWDPLSGQSLA